MRQSILLVEDDDDIREMISQLLILHGYKVDQAKDGSEALAYLRAQDREPCVILLDLIMPTLDGWQLLEILQHDDYLVAIPVVVVSATVEESALPAGVRFVKKPIGIDVLIQAIQGHCGPPSPKPS